MQSRGKIKTDLTNFFSIEETASFNELKETVFAHIAELLKSKKELSSMTGWIDLPQDSNLYNRVLEFTEKIKAENKYEHLLVIGIGGSSLGAQALIEGLKTPLWNRLSKTKRKGFLTVDFIDNLDPQVIRTILSRLKLDQTLFVVISKGGGTVETIVPMLIAKEWTGDNFYKQCVFITGVETHQGVSLLYELSKKHSIPVFPIPENVGGRYSVFSSVGLLPASLGGIDLLEIKEGITEAREICQAQDLRINLAASIALCAYCSYMAGKNIFVLMPYSTCLRRFVDWFVQLWAESLGKQGKGSTPMPAIGATDQHSQIQLFNEGPNDKLICFIKTNKHKRDIIIPDFSSESPELGVYSKHKVGQILNIELDSTRRALTENKRPNILITLPELDEYYLSQMMYIFEFATALCGKFLGVNPFDQPGVELGKKYIKQHLTRAS